MVTLSLGSCFISRSIRLSESEPVPRHRERKDRPRRPTAPRSREDMTSPLFSDSTAIHPCRVTSPACPPSTSSSCSKRARDEHFTDDETSTQSKKRRIHPRLEPLLGSRPQADMDTVKLRLETIKRTPDVIYTREELVNEHGMGLFAWDGKTSHLFLDRGGFIIGVLAGRPTDCEGWDLDCAEAFEAISSAMLKVNLDGGEQVTNLSHGIFLREACQVPLALSWPPHMGVVLESLHGNRSIQRVCKFSSSVFEMFCRASHSQMRSAVEAIRSRGDGLQRCDDSALGVFPCRTFNSGIHTRRPSMSSPRKARDHSHSWTSITALGRFDPRSGGHIVLWDLNLIVEFPPGSTILIPSTLLRYLYTSIEPTDVRCSVEQFATAGTFEVIGAPRSGRSMNNRFTRVEDLLGEKERQ